MTTTSTPADRKVHDILVRIIETMHDESQRELARDLLLTLPAVRDWPHDTLRAAYEPFVRAAPPGTGVVLNSGRRGSPSCRFVVGPPADRRCVQPPLSALRAR